MELGVVNPSVPAAILLELQGRTSLEQLCINRVVVGVCMHLPSCGLSEHSWSVHAHTPFHSQEEGQPAAVQMRGPGGGGGGGGGGLINDCSVCHRSVDLFVPGDISHGNGGGFGVSTVGHSLFGEESISKFRSHTSN